MTREHTSGANSSLRLVRKAAVAVIGFGVLGFGVALIVLPGPAVLVVPLGLAILATEFLWARKLLLPLGKLVRRLKLRAQQLLGRQPLEAFAAWDGLDYDRLPLLFKVKGKCTTGHISPAGSWLRFRGQLDNVSHNIYGAAISAFTGEAGTTRDPLTGELARPVADVARALKAKTVPWIVVGDDNYGEGSSREHAAMSPRLLGAAAIVSRSFARIHESNLKKQGLLPLTFADPTDYDKIQETDRISVRGLPGLAPGRPLSMVLHHADGREDQIQVNHSLNVEQIEWFRAGSALNVLKRQGARTT